ncbi:class III lanthionine synthetase LanKC [Aquimarina rhabdastrellae]
MSPNIERRITKGNLSPFLFNHPLYYTSLGDYQIQDTSYHNIVATTLPEDWNFKRRAVWYVAQPKANTLIPHGFKIHISLLSKLVPQALPKIVEILISHRVAFKMLVDPVIHDYFNGQACSKVSSGKFITIYPPSTAAFKTLLHDLHQVTATFYGPYILSDKPYADSKCLFYRYGSFIGTTKKDVQGDREADYFDTAQTIKDTRTPYFQLPEGIADPFETAVNYPETSLLHNRYEVTEAVSDHSNKGGVYLAIDTHTQEKVIIKEARPFINENRKGQKDTIKGLLHEEHILNRLSQTKVVPRVIDSFYEWEHRFLVLEFIEYYNLSSYADWEKHNIIIKGYATDRDITTFCNRYLTLLQNIIATVEKIHQKGIVIGDLAPQNILYHKDDLSVKLIDFEGTYDTVEDQFYTQITTRGFTVNTNTKPQFSNDWKAVSFIAIHLLLPICHIFALNPEAKDRYLTSLIEAHRLPKELLRLISLLAKDIYQAKIFIRQLQTEGFTIPQKAIQIPLLSTLLTSTVKGIQDHILTFIQQPHPTTFFPVNYRAYTANSLCVAYGISGIAHFLNATSSNINTTIAQTLLQQLSSTDLKQYPPGLFIGTAGIAQTLFSLGHTAKAKEAMDWAYTSPLRNQSADIFNGAAGWGLTSLFFYHQTKNSFYLQKAQEAATIIKQHLCTDKEGIYLKNTDGEQYSGLLHGNSGLALFYLRLFETTQDQKDLTLAKQLLDYEYQKAEYIENRLAWRKSYRGKVKYPYMRLGSVGIGMVSIRFYEVLNDKKYLDWSEKIVHAIQGKYCLLPGLFIGMTGQGEFLLDMYRITANSSYLKEAHAIADRILLYRYNALTGIAFPGEELARLCTDYGTGSSGIGLFLHRLVHKGAINVPYFDPYLEKDITDLASTSFVTENQII